MHYKISGMLNLESPKHDKLNLEEMGALCCKNLNSILCSWTNLETFSKQDADRKLG